MHTSARRSLLSAILVLAMAGCAQSGSNGGGLVSSEHWEVSPPLHDDGMTIDALRTHHSVEIVISTSGKEVRHDTVALQGAAAAIDQVLTVCGRPTHA